MNLGQVAVTNKSFAKSKSVAKNKKYTKIDKVLKTSIGVLIFLVLIGSYFSFYKIYQNKIYPKIMVAGIKLSGLTLDQANQIVLSKANELNNQGPTITYNNQTVQPKLEDLGVSFNAEEVVKLAYNYGRQGGFEQRVIENYHIFTQGYKVDISPSIDENKFDNYLAQIVTKYEKEPVDATLQITNGQVNLIPAQKGLGLDKEQLKNDIKDFINSGQNGQINMVSKELEPKVTNEETTDAKTQAEKYMLVFPLTVGLDSKTWTADANIVSSWIKFNESDGKLAAYVDPSSFSESIANEIEIKAIDKEIEDGTGKVINEGQDGLGVDRETLNKQLKDAVLNGVSNAKFALITFIIPKGEKTIYPHAQPGRYEGRYIDINLSEQTLYAFEGTTLVNSFLVSTGRSGYATPTGEFHIYGQNRYSLMDGPDYYLPNVPFISWFHGDYSIHGTYWHHNFGHVMSHGCVNMDTNDAEWVYNFVSIGTPVYIHY